MNVFFLNEDVRNMGDRVNLIAHGCNCFHTMGAGFARAIKEKWPGAYEADLATQKGTRDKLGMISQFTDPSGLKILNCYTQFAFGRDKQYVEYDALRTCMKKINERFPQKTIALPVIGSNLAGGDYDTCLGIILSSLKDMDTIYILSK